MKSRHQLSKDKIVGRYGPRNKDGSMLVLVVSCVIVLIALGIFALNYNHFFQQNLVGKTAAESAALQYAQDMARVVVWVPDNDEHGNPIPGGVPVALVDQVPQNVTSTGCSAPILGVNTRLATIRMEMVAAAQLGNVAMYYAAQQDYNDLVNCQIPAFNQALQNVSNWKDMNGTPIDPVGDAKAAFNNNLRQDNSASKLVDGSFSATIGFANSSASIYTGMPVTQSSFDSAVSQNQDKYSLAGTNGARVYKAYVPIPIAANAQIYSGQGSCAYPPITETFEFAAVAEAPALVPNNSFQPVTGDANTDPWAPPAVVQITAKETVGSVNGATQPQTMTETATAEVGGALQNFPSGGLCIGFGDGLPVGNTNVFNTVLNIMNWSQPQGALTADTASPFYGWNSNSVGHWFQAQGGPIGAAAVTPGQFVHTHTFKGRNQHDDPSIALSFCIYDWLKTLGPQVNLDSLAKNLEMGAGTANVASITTPYLANAPLGVVASASTGTPQNIAWNWLQEAHAQSSSTSGVANAFTEGTGALQTGLSGKFPGSKMNKIGYPHGGASDDGTSDPRFILNHGQSSTQFTDNRGKQAQDIDQTTLAFGDKSHAVAAPANSINLLINSNGNVTSTTGAPYNQIMDYTAALNATGTNALTSYNNAKAALSDVNTNVANDTSAITSDLAAMKVPPSQTVPAAVTDSKGNVTNQAAINAANAFNSALAGLSAALKKISTDNQSVVGLNGQTPTYSLSQGLVYYAGDIYSAAADAIQKAGAVGASVAPLQDIEARAQGSTATPPADIKAQGGVMVRALYVANNALYVGKVATTIASNDKALTGQGLNETPDNTHFKLAGQDFWPVAASASKAQIEGTGSIATNQNSSDPGVLDWVSSATTLDGTRCNLIVYKYPGSSTTTPSIPAISTILEQPAIAQTSTVPPSNTRMIILGKDPTGNIWTLVTAQTPYAQTAILSNQYMYQDLLALAQDIGDPKEGAQATWVVEARDENATPYGAYFADGSGTNGNTETSDWCKSATFLGSSPPLNKINSIQAQCQHVAAEFRVSCPIAPGACQCVPPTPAGACEATCPPPPPCGS